MDAFHLSRQDDGTMVTVSQFRSDAEVNSLVESGIQWPARCAVKYRNASHSEYDDLVSIGMHGLWDAAIRWHGEGVFEPFARTKIHWRMKDWLSQYSREPSAQLIDVAVGEDEVILLGNQDCITHLEEMLNGLPRRLRCDFILACRIHGVNHHQTGAQELARELDVTPSWIYKRVNGLFRYLRRHHPEMSGVVRSA